MISPVEAWVAERTGLNERLSPGSLQLWQLARVREAIEYARERSRFYAAHLNGIDPARIRSVRDMEGIPFLTPDDLAADPEALVCVPGSEIGRVVTLFTSGSRSSPKRIYFTENDLSRTVDFFAHGMSTMMRSGETAVVMMSGESQYSIGDLLRRALDSIGAGTIIHGHVRDVSLAVEAAAQADCLVGVPGEIIYVCRTSPRLRPQSVLLSADYVPQSVIRSIEDTWECRVFTHYGMTETGYGCGVQCEARSGYHLRDADLLLEIVDCETGRQVEPGQYGEVVITTLANQAMPLIRYRTGDVARMAPWACPCGGVLPTLDKVTGRRCDSISLDNGVRLSISQLDEVVYAHQAVRGYEPELTRVGGAQVLVLTVDAEPRLRREDFAAYVAGSLSPGIGIQVKYASVSPCAGSGKRRIKGETTCRREQ